MPSKEELLNSIKPGMKLTKSFFMRIYGYELTWTGFAEQALSELEKAGCSNARNYYQKFVDEYEQEYKSMMKRVSDWYTQQECKRKEVMELRKRKQEAEQQKKAQWAELSRMLDYR